MGCAASTCAAGDHVPTAFAESNRHPREAYRAQSPTTTTGDDPFTASQRQDDVAVPAFPHDSIGDSRAQACTPIDFAPSSPLGVDENATTPRLLSPLADDKAVLLSAFEFDGRIHANVDVDATPPAAELIEQQRFDDEWSIQSGGAETNEPSDFVNGARQKKHVVIGRLRHGINGDVDQFDAEAEPRSLIEKSSTTVRRWIDDLVAFRRTYLAKCDAQSSGVYAPTTATGQSEWSGLILDDPCNATLPGSVVLTQTDSLSGSGRFPLSSRSGGFDMQSTASGLSGSGSSVDGSWATGSGMRSTPRARHQRRLRAPRLTSGALARHAVLLGCEGDEAMPLCAGSLPCSM